MNQTCIPCRNPGAQTGFLAHPGAVHLVNSTPITAVTAYLHRRLIDILKTVPGFPNTDRALRDMVKNAIETRPQNNPFIANGEANYFTIRRAERIKNNAFIIYRKWSEV
jgi:hypothetical protein